MTEKKKYKVVFDRPGCIGVYPCVEVHPGRWERSDDNKANLIKGTKQDGDLYTLEVELTEEELKRELEAAKSCPVDVIKVYDADGKQLI